ncbi:ABC transporter permease [Bacillus sp. JCM 19034]|uniref:ABC transporter permease n=1 Tax=Bacillus sp. JCM 19034 TaxID=1481928 RepID=UPI00078043A6|nr:ABC transporter permease [Bacillus sp. JCM 19034]
MRFVKINALIQPLFAILIGLIVGAIAMRALGEPILQTYGEMWKGAFGNLYFVMSTLARATPILLIALGVSIAFRAGAFNLGGEGQMVLAAVSSALVALYIPGPGFVKLIAAILIGFSIGGIWSALAGMMEAKFKVQLIISTLLMNYIAVLFASYLVSHPFQDRDGSAALAQTKLLDQAAYIPKLIAGMSVHYGFVIAIVIAIGLFIAFRYTAIGYEVNMLGKNPFFTSYGGVNRSKVMLISMFVSGGIAGLAGVFEVLGSHYRFVDNALTVPDYAWTGIMAALLAKSNPLAVIFSSIFLAALHTGSLGVERNTDVPLEVGSIIQAVLILFISANITFAWIRAYKKERKNNGVI